MGSINIGFDNEDYKDTHYRRMFMSYLTDLLEDKPYLLGNMYFIIPSWKEGGKYTRERFDVINGDKKELNRIMDKLEKIHNPKFPSTWINFHK